MQYLGIFALSTNNLFAFAIYYLLGCRFRTIKINTNDALSNYGGRNSCGDGHGLEVSANRLEAVRFN